MTDPLFLFKGKRVLVTGDTGFKGSWLCAWLHRLQADVLGYALPPPRANDHFLAIGLKKLIRHVTGDINNYPKFQEVVSDFRPEFLFHLAAQSLVRLSYRDPKGTFDTNVGGSVNVLEAIRATPTLRSVVFVTSDKCYLNKEWGWGYRENDELGGRDPYSASKAAAEMVLFAYRESFFNDRPRLGISSVRAGNVIGGGDWAADRLVPDSIRSLQKGRAIPLRNPMSTRPWQHVLDPLYGYLLLAVRQHEDPGRFSRAWNFGPRDDSHRTVQDVAEQIVTCWGQGRIRKAAAAHAPHEAMSLQLNCDQAHQKLGWRPRWGFERAVFETVRWYRQVLGGKPAGSVTKNQILSFMESADDSRR